MQSAVSTSRPEAIFGRPDVEALLASLPQRTAFTTGEWLSAAYEFLHDRRRPEIVTYGTSQGLLGLLPLTGGLELVDGVPLRTLRAAGFPFSDRMPLLVADGRNDLLECLLNALVETAAKWDVILLNELPHDQSVLEAVARWARATKRTTMFRLSSRTPILSLDFADRQSLLNSYSSSLRTRLRRGRKKLAGAGRVEFRRVLPNLEQVPDLLAEIRKVEDASWKGRDAVGIFFGSDQQAFFSAMSRRFAARGWLDLGLLYLDGRLISYRYGFRFREAFWDYNFSYLPEFAHLSPGRVLLDDMILSSFDLGLKIFDGSRGSLVTGNILSDWTDHATENVDLWIFNRTVPARVARLVQTRLRPAFRRLERTMVKNPTRTD